MMARSTTRSNLRPDTLMQDRRRQFDEIFLQRTAGPYIGSKPEKLNASKCFPLHPKNGHSQCNRHVPFRAKHKRLDPGNER
jgi:hypothetical protein